MKMNKSCYCLLFIAIFFFTACKKENNYNTNELYVYAGSGNADYNISSGSVIVFPDEIIQSESLSFPVYISRAYDKDVQVTAEIDTTLLQVYDSINNTVSPRYNSGNFGFLNNVNKAIIKAGSLVSTELLSITIKDTVGLDFSKTHIVPIKLVSVSDVPLSDNRNRMYIKVNFTEVLAQIPSSGSNPMKYSVSKFPDGSYDEPITLGFKASINVALPQIASIKVEVDNSLVAKYNTDNKTSYKSFPDGSYKLIKDEVNLLPGTTLSEDSILISIDNYPMFDESESYILPVRLTANNKIPPSKTNVVYYVFSIIRQNIFQNGILTGSLVDRTDWSATVSSSYSSYKAEKALDGSNSSYWGSSLFSSLPQHISIDMAEVNNLKGIKYTTGLGHSNKYNFAPAIIEVYTSEDNGQWTLQGIYRGSNSGEGVENSIVFFNAVKARYFKLNCTATHETAFPVVGFAEINVVE